MPTLQEQARPSRRRPRWWIAPAAVVLVILIALLIPWKLNFLRGTIAQKVADGTDRSFAIDGDIWLYWLQGPRVTIDGLKMGNPSWASTPIMATIDHIDAPVSLGNLLRKRFVLPSITVEKPVINLEEAPDGKRNWYFDRQQSDSSTSVVVEEVTLDHAHVGYVEKAKDTDVRIELASIGGQDIGTNGGGSTNGIAATATGKYNGLKLDASVKTGDVLKLKNKDTPFPFDIKAQLGSTHATAVGTVTDPATLKAADLKVSLAGGSLGELYRIVGVGLPETPPYSTSGHVVVANGVYRYDDFKGRFGTSDIAGSIAFEKREKRPFVSGTLVSNALDLNDFQPMLGKQPEPAKAPENVDATKPKKLLPQQTFDATKWNSLDADVRFTGKQIKNAGSIPFDNLSIHATMQDRVLSFTPLSFGFAGGTMGGNLRFDGSGEPMHATVDVRFADLELSKLSPKLTDGSKASLGRLNGVVKIDGRGSSIAAMLGSGNGEAQIAMGRGESSTLLLEAVGLQGPQVVRYLLGDRESKIECMLMDFKVKDGTADAQTSLVDTDINVIALTGSVDFKNEQLDLKITPLPKKKSIVVLRTPFYVTGAFADPSVHPDLGTLAARAGGAVALGIVNPLLALIPLIETGPGEDADCAALLAKVRSAPVRNTDTPADEKVKTPAPRATPPTGGKVAQAVAH